jgi:hypothetical protein
MIWPGRAACVPLRTLNVHNCVTVSVDVLGKTSWPWTLYRPTLSPLLTPPARSMRRAPQEAAGDSQASVVRQRLRLLVCGGDGTIAWVLGVIKKLRLQPEPPVAMIPLGTGGWSGGRGKGGGCIYQPKLNHKQYPMQKGDGV